MKLRDAYKKYYVTPNLQNHMLRVASVGGFICDHLLTQTVKKTSVLTVLLLHDLGNTVRMDLEKFPQFLGAEKKRLEYWKKVIKKTKIRYGEDDHKATEVMLTELGLPSKLRKVAGDMVLADVLKVNKDNNTIVKICLYSDMRVAPDGIVSLRERLDDAFARHSEFQGRTELYEGAFELEKQIADIIDIPVTNINSTYVKINRDKLLNFDIDSN